MVSSGALREIPCSAHTLCFACPACDMQTSVTAALQTECPGHHHGATSSDHRCQAQTHTSKTNRPLYPSSLGTLPHLPFSLPQPLLTPLKCSVTPQIHTLLLETLMFRVAKEMYKHLMTRDTEWKHLGIHLLPDALPSSVSSS